MDYRRKFKDLGDELDLSQLDDREYLEVLDDVVSELSVRAGAKREELGLGRHELPE